MTSDLFPTSISIPAPYLLRPYQQAAHDSVMAWVRKRTAPCLVELPTGAGKSLLIAELAKSLHAISGGKRVLVTAPRKELVEQDHEKFERNAGPASIFSASIRKCLEYPVVFGTPLTVLNAKDNFAVDYCAILLDEAHGITPTIKSIIDTMRAGNPNLRVIGLTATPWRLGTGYIFREDEAGRVYADDIAENPYFSKLVYRVGVRALIADGFLTPPVVGKTDLHYDTGGLKLDRKGNFDSEEIDRAFVGQGRLTAEIMRDIVAQSRDRRGVLVYAATVKHAYECLASLPPQLSALITGETPKIEREDILARFQAQSTKYLVNVAVLTIGFDAPHADVIAILRPTESSGLLLQIIGRGLRIFEGKENCQVLDYAQNIKAHCPDGNLFNPQIEAWGSKGGEKLDTLCPTCGTINCFTARLNEENHRIDIHGYFIGQFDDWGKPKAAHFGRRCLKIHRDGSRCGYRWTFKACAACGVENDIAARYCTGCKGELIDPNKKLAFKELKADPTRRQTDRVLSVSERSVRNETLLVVDFITEYREFPVFFSLVSENKRHNKARAEYEAAKGDIRTVTYQQEESGYFRVFGYNAAEDKL